ncbi:glycosyltransferase family 25 protein [Halarcobacter anaerophilus]|nr:glycosyltransferase family 25 protein [Halarcobacter anaerophilus]QDF29515.1 glycosyltransferase, family 25 [Halarcobacter anaerophilus]
MDDDLLGIYYISLKKDEQRREKMLNFFPQEFTKMNYVEAIYGKNLMTQEYYSKLIKFFENTGKLITPSELGCLMSHEKALNTFIYSDYKYALILEDDILGSDADIQKIRDFTKKYVGKNFFFHCGGMDGRKSIQYILGHEVNNKGLYLLTSFSIKHLWRACCYAIDKQTAISLLELYKKNIAVADEWNKILPQLNTKVYAANILHHPIELRDSNIECDRKLKNTKINLINFIRKVFVKLINMSNKYFYEFLGYKNIYNRNRKNKKFG